MDSTEIMNELNALRAGVDRLEKLLTVTGKVVGRSQQTASVKIRKTQEIVAQHFGLAVFTIQGRDRRFHIAWARMVAIWICSELGLGTATEIGSHFSGRYGSMINYARNTVPERLSVYPDEAHEVFALRDKIAGILNRHD